MSDIRLRYQTIEIGDVDIHLCTLRDRQQFDATDLAAARMGISSAQWSLFGVLWPAGEHLAELMLGENTVGKRILEVGCGIGLASLLLNSRGADISAMDYHPAAETFLDRNVELNDGDRIPFLRANWENPDTAMGTFDLIIGSDLLYEDEHAADLARFIARHAAPGARVILIDPGRGQRGRFASELLQQGFSRLEGPGQARPGQERPGQTRSGQAASPDTPAQPESSVLRFLAPL
ncbi:MAG: class I SAM-dependent methyltransferase [Pseudomonadota bacterium]